MDIPTSVARVYGSSWQELAQPGPMLLSSVTTGSVLVWLGQTPPPIGQRIGHPLGSIDKIDTMHIWSKEKIWLMSQDVEATIDVAYSPLQTLATTP